MLPNFKHKAIHEYKRILDIIAGPKGFESKPRDQKVRETFLEELHIDPYYPILEFKERRFAYKYLAGEFQWYFQKELTLEKINDFSSFWKNITNSDETVNSNYGSILFGKQLRWVYDSLISDKDSRQAIAFLNEPKYQYKGNRDFVCTMYLNFFIRNNKLNMKMNIRSNDMVFGFSYDAPFFSFIQQYMYLWLKETKYPELELGTYIHYADNIHYYERHFDIMDKIRTTQPLDELEQPRFELHTMPFTINENGFYTLTKTGLDFCNNVAILGKDGVKEYQPYIKQLQTIFNIN